MNIDAIRVIICSLIYISERIPFESLFGLGTQPTVTNGVCLPRVALFLTTLILLQHVGLLFLECPSFEVCLMSLPPS